MRNEGSGPVTTDGPECLASDERVADRSSNEARQSSDGPNTDLVDEMGELSPEEHVELERLEDTIERKRNPLSPVRLALLKKAEESVLRAHEANKPIVYERLRSEQRAAYRRARELEGKTVRSYKRHSYPDAPENEASEERVRRHKRESARCSRGKSGETVRAYNDLSEMTVEEKAEYKRKQASERKRAQREAQRAGKSS